MTQSPTTPSTGVQPLAGSSHRVQFVVTAPADPGMLSRIIEPMAKLGHVPRRVHASREDGDGSVMTVDLRLDGVSARTAELVEFALRAIVGVGHVMAVLDAQDGHATRRRETA